MAARALVTQGGLSFLSTPELLATVAPVLAVGTVYCGGYGLGLVRLDR